jgi:hypothetical protein
MLVKNEKIMSINCNYIHYGGKLLFVSTYLSTKSFITST